MEKEQLLEETGRMDTAREPKKKKKAAAAVEEQGN